MTKQNWRILPTLKLLKWTEELNCILKQLSNRDCVTLKTQLKLFVFERFERVIWENSQWPGKAGWLGVQGQCQKCYKLKGYIKEKTT